MIFQKMNESCALTNGMADRLGISVGDATHVDAERTAAAYRSAVFKCMGCKEHAACTILQAENKTLEKAPDYCRNW